MVDRPWETSGEAKSEVKRTSWLSDADVRGMRTLASKGASQAYLSERYSYCVSAVSLILRGLRRRKAGGPIISKGDNSDE